MCIYLISEKVEVELKRLREDVDHQGSQIQDHGQRLDDHDKQIAELQPPHLVPEGIIICNVFCVFSIQNPLEYTFT